MQLPKLVAGDAPSPDVGATPSSREVFVALFGVAVGSGDEDVAATHTAASLFNCMDSAKNFASLRLCVFALKFIPQSPIQCPPPAPNA